jgi:signal transduction histidine kinase
MARESDSDLTLEGLVHDLNNVFETISGAAALLAGDSKWSRVASTISRSVARGRRLLGTYADQSMSELDLAVIVERAAGIVGDLGTLLPSSEVEISANIEPGLLLRGLASDWERVFMNLFLNSVQAMKDGGRIEVEAQKGDGGLEVDVSDTGPGIPARILPDIFKRNVSTRGSRRGLGLQIVDSIVRRNGGTVTAENREGGRGATFRITLPDLETQ